MPEEEESKRENPFTRFFSKIGMGVISTSRKTADASSKVKGAIPGLEKGEKSDLSERILELREMERRSESRETFEEEEESWEGEREELETPLSERFADVFYGIFRGPAGKLSGYFGDLEGDLYRANMEMSPDRYVSLLLGIGVIGAVASFIFSRLIFENLLISLLIALGGFGVPVLIGRTQPKSVISSRASEINQEIPYALRHMASQLSSGVGLPESMASVADADYGALSEEFRLSLLEMRRGESMEGALSEIRNRSDSEYLSTTIRQIQRTLRTGGNLARTLRTLADEAAFDLRMNLRDYTQSLNMMTMVYMFASAVIPPLLIVIMIVSQFMGAAFMPPQFITILYLVIIPFLLFYLVIIFKRMEPEV